MKHIPIITLISIIILVGVTGIVSAELVFKQNTIVDLKLPCSYNGSFCDNTAVCNITISYPNESLLINNELMTNTGNGKPNITLSGLEVTGIYHGLYSCCQNTYCDSDDFEMEVTPTGDLSTTGDSILYSLFSLILFGIITVLSFLVFTMPSKNHKDERGFEHQIVKVKYLRLIFIALIYVLMILLLNFLNALAVNYSSLSVFSGILGFLFEILLRLAWPLTVIIMVWIVYMLIHDTNINKQLKKIERTLSFYNN